jgi:hypothetical protein
MIKENSITTYHEKSSFFHHSNTYPGLFAHYKVHTEDILHFWEAYDECQKTENSLKRIEILQKLYVDRGTKGLAEFMEMRGGRPDRWLPYMSMSQEKLKKI